MPIALCHLIQRGCHQQRLLQSSIFCVCICRQLNGKHCKQAVSKLKTGDGGKFSNSTSPQQLTYHLHQQI